MAGQLYGGMVERTVRSLPGAAIQLFSHTAVSRIIVIQAQSARLKPAPDVRFFLCRLSGYESRSGCIP